MLRQESHAYLSLSLSSHPFTARRWNPSLRDYWRPGRPLRSALHSSRFQNLLSPQPIIKTTEPNLDCQEQRKKGWLQEVSPSNVTQRYKQITSILHVTLLLGFSGRNLGQIFFMFKHLTLILPSSIHTQVSS
jgi:hypothetical protein